VLLIVVTMCDMSVVQSPKNRSSIPRHSLGCIGGFLFFALAISGYFMSYPLALGLGYGEAGRPAVPVFEPIEVLLESDSKGSDYMLSIWRRCYGYERYLLVMRRMIIRELNR